VTQRQIAVFVLQSADTASVELKNIAIAEGQQGKGLGSFLMQQMELIAAEGKFKEINVGTPDTAKRQINFYEKNGYLKSGLRENFFVKNYPCPIIENGVVLKDMQMLRKIIL
jgi:ribosomal protein S18 acetylase RimI-like enzyme